MFVVFGKNKELIKGLENGERILMSWEKVTVATTNRLGGLAWKDYNYAITNMRAIRADKKGKIESSCQISGAELLTSIGQDNYGDLEFWQGGTCCCIFYNIRDPKSVAMKIERFSFQNSTNRSSSVSRANDSTDNRADDSVRGSLPRGYTTQSTTTTTTQSPTTTPIIQTPHNTSDEPLKILKLRFVKGEITKEEFEEMKRMLG